MYENMSKSNKTSRLMALMFVFVTYCALVGRFGIIRVMILEFVGRVIPSRYFSNCYHDRYL